MRGATAAQLALLRCLLRLLGTNAATAALLRLLLRPYCGYCGTTAATAASLLWLLRRYCGYCGATAATVALLWRYCDYCTCEAKVLASTSCFWRCFGIFIAAWMVCCWKWPTMLMCGHAAYSVLTELGARQKRQAHA